MPPISWWNPFVAVMHPKKIHAFCIPECCSVRCVCCTFRSASLTWLSGTWPGLSHRLQAKMSKPNEQQNTSLCQSTIPHSTKFNLFYSVRENKYSCHNFRRSRLLSLLGLRSAVDVTGFLAIAAPFFIFPFVLSCSLHTWFSFANHTACI